MPKLSITMPTYNEEEIIQQVVADLQTCFNRNELDYELVIVNNGSKDNTLNILEELNKKDSRIRYINIEHNQGYGWGIINGLKNCHGEIIGYIDGDNQIEPEDIVTLYRIIQEKKGQFIKGIRKSRKDGILRIIESLCYNSLFKFIFFTNISDINAKPKMFTKTFYQKLNLESKDWFVDAEIVIKSIKMGIKPLEHQVKFNERKKGKSNVKLNTTLEFIKNLIIWRLKK
jgi:glycosyltransferase involved in cell wall biosynthesis